MATEALAEGEGRLSEDLSEERGTGLKKEKVYKIKVHTFLLIKQYI